MNPFLHEKVKKKKKSCSRRSIAQLIPAKANSMSLPHQLSLTLIDLKFILTYQREFLVSQLFYHDSGRFPLKLKLLPSYCGTNNTTSAAL